MPYVSSLNSSGPSHISVELCHNNLPTLPVQQPIVTAGLLTIKVSH